jgi:hypothetical protein
MSASAPHVLTVVIPALNEEDAIGSTIQRCLDARAHIIERSGVEEVEIIVVSDGSTDRTEEIARSFEEVTVLVFVENRGYGAAIQKGFELGKGDLVSFLDGDGTCDPRCFADLCRAIDEQNADLVLGSRMGKGSKMPLIRTIGNMIFAWILGGLSRRRIDDTASGMRVIRRSALAHLYPLPDGLHFTPAMSARALMEGRLHLVELPMPYAERLGRSKLSVLKDGVRFLTCIVQAAIAYRPARPLLLASTAIGVLAMAIAAAPAHFYLRETRIEEWMIYRLLLASLLVTIGSIGVMSSVVADRIAARAHGRDPTALGLSGWVSGLFTRRGRRVALVALLIPAFALVYPGLVEYVSSGHVEMHWSRAVLASLMVVLVTVFGITVFLLHMLELIDKQLGGATASRLPERIHAARPRSVR